MLEAVTAGMAQHGWQAVPSAECHDFTCVGPAAAAAKVSYAVILTAGFAHGGDAMAMYATDVGASLWRDGTVVARRTEDDEKSEAEKNPASVFFPCGPPSGTCVAPLIASKMQQYSGRLLDAENSAIEQRTAAAAAAAKPAVPPETAAVVAIPAAPPAQPPSGNGVGRVLGWSLIGGGALAIGGGLTLWAYDNSGTDCHGVSGSGCRQSRETGTAAAVIGGVGAAAAVTGALVLILDRGDSSHLALAISPAGLVVGGIF